MSIDQQNDDKWKELAKRKRDAIMKWQETMNNWINETDPLKRVELRRQEEGISKEVASADRALEKYVQSKGGY
jgi:hypothetical protein